MGTLSIWHWLPLILVAGLMIGTALWLKRRSARKYPGELRGIGGWLAILAIVVTLWPVQALWTLWEYVGKDGVELWNRFPVVFYGELALFVMVFILAAASAVAMHRKSNLFPRIFIGFCVFMLSLYPVHILWVSTTLSLVSETSFATLAQDMLGLTFLKIMIASVIGFGVWMLYVLRSKRVANTFVN
jgi:hypothetical protein